MRLNAILSVGALGSLLVAQGCIATRDWVKEQMDPVSNRVSQGETRLTEGEGRLTQSEKQIGTMIAEALAKLKKDQRSGTYIVTGFAKTGDGGASARR